MFDPTRSVGAPAAPDAPAAKPASRYLDATLSYPRPGDEHGTAEAVIQVPAGRFRPDQPALTLQVQGEGADLSVAAFDADGTPRMPNPSEILLIRDTLFGQMESGTLSPVEKAQVVRAIDTVCVLFSQTTPNREAYTASTMGGYRTNPAEIGLPRGTMTLDPKDNVYIKARQPKSFAAPILLWPKDGGPPTVF